MSRKLGYGLIGCGVCGELKHLASYKKVRDEVEIVALFDVDPQKSASVADRNNVPQVYQQLSDLLADDRIDVVSIATPSTTHAEIVIAALHSGKHVHVEKPITISAQEAQAIVSAKNESGRKLMVGLNNRFTPLNQFIKRYVQEGHLGQIYHARCGWRRRAEYPMFGSWFVDKSKSGGGPLLDLGVHFIDLTMHMMGFPAPSSVSCVCSDFLAREYQNATNSKMLGRNKSMGLYDVEDIATGFIRFDTPASIAFEFSYGSHIERETRYMQLLGSRGGLSLVDDRVTIFSEQAGELVDVTPQVPSATGWGDAEVRHFIDCITHDQSPLATPEEGVKMMQIIESAYLSAKTGRETIMNAGANR